MNRWLAALSIACIAAIARGDSRVAKQNEQMLQQLRQEQGLSDAQIIDIRGILQRSGFATQGNPAITEHPVSPEQCHAELQRKSIDYANPKFEAICHAKYMAPLYNPKTQVAEDAKVCIDQFEFPDIPCAYPLVWTKAKEAAQICAAEGKRICDAHEWEGACAGDLEPPDYRFDLAQGVEPEEAIRRMRAAHNRAYAASKSWSYGPQYKPGICATASQKSPDCTGDNGNWSHCGSNTYPAGDFPKCHSALDVYDLNGNAAEHMNLPISEDQMASRGSTTLGYTEMKGSWFIFDSYYAHQDWCRWRAPFWHGSKVMSDHSHANYHLGFRCCKDS
jgi:hypothetical protein